MHQILIVVQVLVAIALIGIVLIQQGRGADAGAAFGSGGSGTIFGARGPATVLTRITAGLAVAFFVNSIALAYVARSASDQRRSVVEIAPVVPGMDDSAADTPPSVSVPSAPGVAPETAPEPDATAAAPATQVPAAPAVEGEAAETEDKPASDNN